MSAGEEHQPLTITEWLEVLATGEVVARTYRHPVEVDRALRAGATWEQVADARGCDETQARQDYREWAEGQHNLWTGVYGGQRGRFGMDDAECAEAIERAEAGPAGGIEDQAAAARTGLAGGMLAPDAVDTYAAMLEATEEQRKAGQ